MPGVVVHPSSPGLGGFDPLLSSSNDKYSGYMNTSVADIKNKARETVLKEAGRASALSLIRTARAQVLSAKEREVAGDLTGALENYIKAATLVRMTLDSSEFKQEKGKGGVLRKEVNEFLQGTGGDLTARTQSIEEKLKAFEANKQSNNPESSGDKSTGKSFGSIADRVRALQDSGLSIGPTKLHSREAPSLPNSPLSTTRFSPTSQPSSSTALSNATPSTSTSSTQPPHAFVSPSSFGPPSPGSSPSSSPQINTTFELAGFAQAFPSIDEFDESLAKFLPSVPTGISTISSKPSSKDIRDGDTPASPSTTLRNFALHIERPSSTPITPTSNVFTSRPASPTRQNVPPKPSGLSSTTQPTQVKNPIPKSNIAFPKDLLAYMREYKVLLIDVRNRADFDRVHVKAEAVVCVEPTVLMRENVTAEALEDAMVIAPKHEAALFANRDKFDLVAVCDESSTAFGASNTPLSILVRVINEQAFRKILKRMPVLLVGGIEAWKHDLGGNELVQSEGPYSETIRLSPAADKFPTSLSSSPSITSPKNPFVLNGLVSSPSLTPSIEPRPALNPFRTTNGIINGDHRPGISLDHAPSHSRIPAEINHMDNAVIPEQSLQRRPAMARPGSSSISFSYSDNGVPVASSPPTINGSFSSIAYPQFAQRTSPTGSGTTFVSPPDITSPPIASINPSPLSWRRNDYVDQSQEALSGYTARGPIDYPELLPQTILRPPPAAASSTLERQDNRPRVQPAATTPSPNLGPKPPRINSDYPVLYWSDTQIGLSGLKNLGNTCYMNAPIQCLSAAIPFARFFTEHRWKSAINYTNPLGSKGRLTGAFAKLLHEMWGGDLPYLTPIEFRKSICQLRSQYDNSDQHDSQEFLSFLMDGIHEDLNRVMVKPVWAPTPEQEAELERLPSQIASEREWRAWKARNDSLIVDFFQGQFRSRLECLTCHQTSTTYNVFSILQLPIPHGRSGRVQIERCLDEFFSEEILEKDDAWDCPKCKAKRRASKKLSLARLPPILLIHLKRFEANGRFSDKVDTFVEFPMKSLDLTNYMPAPLPPGADKSELNGGLPMSLDDPRTQLPPYRYDLYGVTNHYGNLTSGHYTAFVASRGGWMHCDDSSVKAVDPKQVVNQKAYVLFYKRVRS